MMEGLGKLDPELQAIVLVVRATGARPTEVINLEPQDIVLDTNIPHIVIRPNANRPAAKRGNERPRAVPVVETKALEALRSNPSGFPTWATRENFATTKVTTTLRHGLYGYRHAMADRLRQAGVAEDVAKDVLGHSRGTHGAYGSDQRLEAKAEALSKVWSV